MSVTVALRGAGTRSDLVESTPPDVSVADSESAADLLLAVGDASVRSLADEPPPVPVLAVDAGVGRHGISADRVEESLGALAASSESLDDRTVPHPVVSVTVGAFRARAMFDVTLVTSEPAHISEYAVTDATGEFASFRADGVVVATPAGSAGYGHAAGGPVLTTGAGFAVVPISPYTTRPCTWVVDPSVTLSVLRDETPVSLVVDGRDHRQVGVDDPVELGVARTVDFVRPPVSADGARRLEKL